MRSGMFAIFHACSVSTPPSLATTCSAFFVLSLAAFSSLPVCRYQPIPQNPPVCASLGVICVVSVPLAVRLHTLRTPPHLLSLFWCGGGCPFPPTLTLPRPSSPSHVPRPFVGCSTSVCPAVHPRFPPPSSYVLVPTLGSPSCPSCLLVLLCLSVRPCCHLCVSACVALLVPFSGVLLSVGPRLLDLLTSVRLLPPVSFSLSPTACLFLSFPGAPARYFHCRVTQCLPSPSAWVLGAPPPPTLRGSARFAGAVSLCLGPL